MDYVIIGLATAGTIFGVIGLLQGPVKPATQTDWWAQYNRYLKTPEWQTKRQAVIRRAEGRCEICGMRKPIQAHHLRGSYLRIPNEDPWDLAALCFNCHKWEHEMNRQGATLFDKRKRHHP